MKASRRRTDWIGIVVEVCSQMFRQYSPKGGRFESSCIRLVHEPMTVLPDDYDLQPIDMGRRT